MDELAGKQPEKGKRRGNSQTVMNSRKEGHYGVENDEIYLVVVVVVDVGTRRFVLSLET